MTIEDVGPRIQAAAERHMDKVWDAYYEQEDADAHEDIPSPAVGPFCGCQTCVVREVLAGAWPEIETYFALGLASEHDDWRPDFVRPADSRPRP